MIGCLVDKYVISFDKLCFLIIDSMFGVCNDLLSKVLSNW